MLKLRKILLYDIIYYVIIFISLIFFILKTVFINYNSSLNIEQTEFTGTISSISLQQDKLSFVIKEKEKIKCTYYIKTLEEQRYIQDNLEEGDILKIKGILDIPSQNTIPNTFNYQKYLSSQHIYYLLKVEALEISEKNTNTFLSIKNKLKTQILKYDNNDYLLTFIMGDKSYLDEEIFSNYRLLGITHLFAISGMHISLFATFLLFILKKIKLKENLRYLITILFLIFYAFLTNFSPSVLRATIFFALLSLNKIFYTEIKTFNIFLLTISILIFINPFILYNIGAQYSIVTSGSLILASNYLNGNNYLINLFKVSFIAFLFSLPITAINFYEINLLSVLNNLIFVPYVSIILYPFLLITFLLSFLSPILNILIYIMEYLSILLSKISLNILIPKISIIFWLIYYFLLIIIIKFNKKKYYLLIIMMLLINRYKYLINNNSYLYFLDVSQGDSILLISPKQKEIIMIDTGGRLMYEKETWQNKKEYQVSDNILIFLKSFGIKKIDYLILTHGDDDHMRESLNIVSNYKVKNVIFNVGDFNSLEYELINILKQKKIVYYQNVNSLSFNEQQLLFLNTRDYRNENDNSSVIYLNYNNVKILLMGDAGKKKEEDILKEYQLKSIDFIKIGHHGSDTSSSQKFIKNINPKNCIISVGKNNKYNHPKQSVLNILNKCRIYRTDINGSIEIKIDKSDYKIKTYKP